MAELVRSRSERQIWITRGHLAALGLATLFIAILAFLVGLQVGRQGVEGPISAAPAPLLPNPEDEDALSALLREVEYAQGTFDPNGDLMVNDPEEKGITFPGVLAGAEGIPGSSPKADREASLVSIDPQKTPPSRPADAPSQDIPTTGWAIQIASYPTALEADEHVEALKEKGFEAYRVAALVDSTTWYRVRLGGFSTRHRADTARRELMVRLGVDDILVAEAP